MFREVDVSALPALGQRKALVVLGEGLLILVPFCVIWWIVRRIGEVLRLWFLRLWSLRLWLLRFWSLRKGGPVANSMDAVPVEAGEER